mmetsp:Transcript_33946/g.80594  ORF Transcript_33946/g.80594 Transcript_33946/m.80594 type:complete len:288 (-) Transcript_33946:185-1048(-)
MKSPSTAAAISASSLCLTGDWKPYATSERGSHAVRSPTPASGLAVLVRTPLRVMPRFSSSCFHIQSSSCGARQPDRLLSHSWKKTWAFGFSRMSASIESPMGCRLLWPTSRMSRRASIPSMARKRTKFFRQAAMQFQTARSTASTSLLGRVESFARRSTSVCWRSTTPSAFLKRTWFRSWAWHRSPRRIAAQHRMLSGHGASTSQSRLSAVTMAPPSPSASRAGAWVAAARRTWSASPRSLWLLSLLANCRTATSAPAARKAAGTIRASCFSCARACSCRDRWAHRH